jgi:ligand-binding sensor domain-containing protein
MDNGGPLRIELMGRVRRGVGRIGYQPRPLGWLAAMVVTLGLVAAALWWFVIIPARVDAALRRAAARPAEAAVDTVLAPATALTAATDGIRFAGPSGDSRDALVAFGRLWVATAGGLRVHDLSGRYLETLAAPEGLASADVTALARFRGWLVAGHGDGALTLVDGDSAQVLRFAHPTPAPVVGLAADRRRLYVATRGAGLVVWDGTTAKRLAPGPGVAPAPTLTALAITDERIAVGTTDGRVLTVRGDDLVAMLGAATSGAGRGASPEAAAVENGPITALAWDGDDLLVGRTTSVTELAADGTSRVVRGDLFVTALLADPQRGRLLAGTFDHGVVVIRGSAAPNRGADTALPAGAQVVSLRLVEGTPVAFTSAGAVAIGDGGPRRFAPAPHPALAGGSVTALAGRDHTIVVGTFRNGLAAFDQDGTPRGPIELPAAYGLDQINQISVAADSGELTVGTARGLVIVDRQGGVRRVTTQDGLAGAQVAGFAREHDPPLAPLAAATNRGLTILTSGGARSLGAVQGLPNGHATCVAWLGPDELAVGTLSGLGLVHVGQTLRVERSIGAGAGALGAGWVSALVAAPEGLWIGTYGGGVARLGDDGQVAPVAWPLAHPGAVRVNPGAMALTAQALWVGTLDHGLWVIERQHQRAQPVPLPLGSADVTALWPTTEALWIGTNHGVFRVTWPALAKRLGGPALVPASPLAAR